jgi:predicted transcriptional regulator
MAHLAVAFLWRFSGASLSLPWRLLAAPDRAVLAIARRQDYIARMDTAPRPGDRADTLSPETEAERQRRLAWEAEGIAEARADVAAGRLVDAAKVRAWVDSLRTDNPLPVPYSGR